MFVDYAGTTLDVVDGATGEVRVCQLFVAVLGASNYTYAEATFTQRLVDWIGSHVRALRFFGGVPGHAILDRIVHNAYRLELDGPSMRKLKASEQMQSDMRMSEKDAARGASAPVRKSAR